MNRYRKGVLRKAVNQLKLKKVTKEALFNLVIELEQSWEEKVVTLQEQLTIQQTDSKRLAEAAHGVLRTIRRLNNKSHLIELWDALKPFDVIPVAIYVNPQDVLAVQPKGPRRGKKQ